jgi:hypothetical protein
MAPWHTSAFPDLARLVTLLPLTWHESLQPETPMLAHVTWNEMVLLGALFGLGVGCGLGLGYKLWCFWITRR